MNKALKAKHLTQAADELRVVSAALNWYRAQRSWALILAQANQPDSPAQIDELRRLLEQLRAACEQLDRPL
jgi:predicted MarR family transcription regulator